MAESSFNPSVRQGFNFEKDSQDMVGHINSLKIGDKEMKSDFSVTDPEDVAALIKVFGVMSNIYWLGGYADPVQFGCNVSTDNKNFISTLLHKSMSNTEVELEFTVYDYDPREKKYYKCFHTNAVKLKCLVEKSGGELSINIDADQAMEVVSPKNFSFALGSMPQDVAQEIHLAVSLSDKFVKKFGIEVA
ncbi:MAG: hypothetical protein KAI47_07460 [Deltaproteobacteria bacterium]|nr:hypothetical protein [Deltaproteobacteria bacterium]